MMQLRTMGLGNKRFEDLKLLDKLVFSGIADIHDRHKGVWSRPGTFGGKCSRRRMLTFRSLGVHAKASVEFKTPEAYSTLNLEMSFGHLFRRKETYGERNTQGPDQSRKNGDL
ncbi:hypothetical protein Tco_1188351 [Tanacetum coccineum]